MILFSHVSMKQSLPGRARLAELFCVSLKINKLNADPDSIRKRRGDIRAFTEFP